MSILREAGRAQCLACDTCGTEGDEFDQGDFGRMIEAAKRDGWKITLVDGEWTHTCDGCADDPMTALQKARLLFNHKSN